MTQQIINVGSAINDGTGDPARTAFTKSNDNFTELYAWPLQCGRLVYVSATALSFKPYNGDRIKIAGVVYAIPSTGLPGLGNTGVFVNGTAGQNLAVSTSYYAFAFINAGVPTADFRPTSACQHLPDTASGNAGVEVISFSGTPISSHTLIGMVQTNASSQFQDDVTFRGVISWFNRRNIQLTGAVTSGVTTTSGTSVELATSSRIQFLTWGEENIHLGLTGTGSNNTATAFTVAELMLDGSIYQRSILATSSTAGAWGNFSSTTPRAVSEGYHYATPAGSVGSGIGTFYMQANGMIRG